MQTVDFHTHLLNPAVRFDRPFDRFALLFFAAKQGMPARELLRDPYENYKKALITSIRTSRYVTKVCLYPVDGRFDEQGEAVHRDPTVCSSTEDVLALYHAHPDLFIPFMSVNPRRKNALDLIDEYVRRGCRGAKFLQNYWGVDLNDPGLIPYYEKLREHGIPMVVHTGPEYTIDSYREYESVRMIELPLKTGVTVVAAHMGAGRPFHRLFFWRNFLRDPVTFDREYFTLLELLEKHKNLYADLSSMLMPFKARMLPHLAKQTQIHGRLLFGSDYPVPFATLFNLYGLSWRERRRIARIDNPFDRYIEVLLRFFPEESPVYSNYMKIFTQGGRV